MWSIISSLLHCHDFTHHNILSMQTFSHLTVRDSHIMTQQILALSLPYKRSENDRATFSLAMDNISYIKDLDLTLFHSIRKPVLEAAKNERGT